MEFVENLSGGNVREALVFLNTFVGSGHINTLKILDIEDEDGNYLIRFTSSCEQSFMAIMSTTIRRLADCKPL